MTSYQVSELVSGLKSRHAEARHKAIRELLQFAKTDLREIPPDNLTHILDDFNQQIHAMTSSYDNIEKKAGILTIVCLIGGDVEITKTRTSRYVHYLRNVFPSNDMTVLELGAKTMGRLAYVLSVKQGEYVEYEIKRSYEWLAEERNEAKRLSAAFILRELAIAMPTYFYQQINGFFSHILIALRDPKEQTREAAAKALRAALVVTSQRELPEQSTKIQWYSHCFEEAMITFSDYTVREKGLSRDDYVHGALLILNELLRCSNAVWEKKYTMLMQKLDVEQELSDDMLTLSSKIAQAWPSQHFDDEKSQVPNIYESHICKQLLTENYEKICLEVMAQQISRAHNVHAMLLLMIPRLAAFNRELFVKRHLKSTINHLTTFLHGKEKEKAMAFTTLGLICVAVESDIQQYLGRIIEIIKLSLPTKDIAKKRIGVDTPLFNCVTLLGFAMKEKVCNEIKELLDPMCTTGLSPQLTICFKELSHNLPALKKDITDRLLNMLSLILRKKPYANNSSEQQIVYMLSSVLSVEPHDANKLVLALHTLGTFDFEWNNTLMAFIRRCTDHYLQSEQHDVRIEAVKTIAKLLIKAIEKCAYTNSRTLNLIIDESLGKLLAVGRSDLDHEVRYRVLDIFKNPVFDKYLAVQDHLSCFFVAINDSNIEIGELALCIVGRLSNMNPSYTTPTLRQLFVQILLEIQHSESVRNKEQALRMVNNLITHAPRFTRQYVNIILKVLVPKLTEQDTNPTMISAILKSIGDLAEVNGDGTILKQWLHELVSIQLGILSDPNQLEMRSVALWSFGQVISATGYVVIPYSEYPNLMDTLLNFLKTEQQTRERRETLRVLGLLGALDPYKYKVNQGLIDFQTVSTLIPVLDETNEIPDSSVSEMLVNMSPLVLDEFYPAVVLSSLMRILCDPQLAQHHTSVVHSVTFIFQTLGIKCVPYISRVMPSLLSVIRNTENYNFREFLFTQLALLISVVKIHIRAYLEDIFDIIKEYWSAESPLLPTLIMLIEHITVAIGTEFKIYIRKILPNMLKVLKYDSSKDKFLTEKLLLAIQKFENNLDDVLLAIVPAITALFDGRNIPMSVSKLAMETIEHLSMYLYLKPYTAIIIQSLAKVLDNNPTLRQTAMNTLCALIIQLGREYLDYIPSMERLMLKHKIQCPNYMVLVSRLQIVSTLASDDDYLDETRCRLRNQKKDVVSATDTQTIQKLSVNIPGIRKCWVTNNLISKEDWMEWLRQLSLGFLTRSNSPAIRACSTLAQNYPILASELFNAAFMSCWTELDDNSRKDLINSLEQALKTPDTPELSLAVLNLVEFMEHCEKGALPISIKLLGDTAISCRAYAKALYYKEEEYRKTPTTQVVEALIHINNKLQQKEAANGLLERVMKQKKNGDISLNVHVRWYEKLHSWELALDLYEKKLELEPHDHDSQLGMMRCLEAMGEWRKLYDIVGEQWERSDDDMRKRCAKAATAASWGLQEWDSMKLYVKSVSEDTLEGEFYRAIIAIYDGQWAQSRHYIDSARSLLDGELTAVAGENYQRAYGSLVNAQLLTELEEVITYKLVEERRSTIRKTWWERLQGGQRLVEDWRKMLQIRSLVMSPREDCQTWLKFASLCRKSGSVNQAHNIVLSIIGSDPASNPDILLRIQNPRVVLAYSKNMWEAGTKRYAYDVLQRFVNAEPESEEHCKLLARCHLKLGSWCESLHEINELSIPEILKNYAAASILAPDWYKACHAWACMNFETVLFYKQQDNVSDSSLAGGSGEKKVSRADFINTYTIPAIEGFFKSISLSKGNSLQDTLRLLTLWFDHGHHPAVYDALFEGIRQIDINIWLQVIPQLIARIDSPRSLVAKLVHILLIDIGKLHPQALVYPLTVAMKSSFVTRKNAANYILKTMCTHSQKLVDEAAIISEELIKVAILWHDQVFIALDEASRLYYSERDYKGMFRTLDNMHAMLDQPPETLMEVSFLQLYGRDLKEAQRWCEQYKEGGEQQCVNEAWELYYQVFRKLAAQFRGVGALQLGHASARLRAAAGLQLAVPGSYVPAGNLVNIHRIHPHLQIIKSKQRPRRLTIQGSDGKQYMFLLKGHEDLRQDERVMQLFGLVNTLLQADTNTYRHDLAIQRYAVVPLSPNSGLIGWVPQCDTLYNLICDYRSTKLNNKMGLNVEQQLMLRMASDYQKLMLMQKVEVFEHTLSQTSGGDLARLLWLKSPSAEVWFERRTNYTRSLAVMSMVGYILGLGDRHPSNIMLHRVTGKVLHIDFGDCFEVTQTREKFPEKIPFRLTRMLINAMEVTGIEGTYRFTCESVMHVLHKHRDSVMAVLEAFVYDPLLNWRLVDNDRHSLTESTFSSDLDSSYTLPSRSRNHLHYESIEIPPEINLNKRALAILNRIRDKLTGRDFPQIESVVSVPKQVDLLIKLATNNENLCQCYIGWCPFW